MKTIPKPPTPQGQASTLPGSPLGKACRKHSGSCRQGYVLFYMLVLLTLLGFYGSISLGTQMREARAARNYVRELQAMSHAESGARLVKVAVERRLAMGMELDEALVGLSVRPPADFDFDQIDRFEVLASDKLFGFTSIGRSGDAEMVLEVQYLWKDPVLKAGVYGTLDLSTRPSVSIYGYDSRIVESPTPSDSNGLATMGSNHVISLGNAIFLDGTVLIGADEEGAPAVVEGADSLPQQMNGHMDPDPLGANGGDLADTFARVAQDNDNDLLQEIVSTALNLRPNSTVTFTAGEYYFTDLYTPPRTNVVIDDSDGPVKFYVDGEIDFQPQSLSQGSDSYNFQIYSLSSEPVTIKPNGSLGALIYAPNAQVNVLPNGDFRGVVWSKNVLLQPSGNLYIDTSIQERLTSDELKVHAWFLRRDS